MKELVDIFNPALYYFEPYCIPYVLVAVLVFIFGFFIFSFERDSRLHQAVWCLCISSALWLAGHSMILNCNVEETVLFWARIQYMGLIFVAANIFYISIAYTNRYAQEQKFVWGLYAMAVFLSIFTTSPLFIEGVRVHPWGFSADTGTLFSIFILFVLLCFLLGLQNLISYYRQSKGLEKKRTIYLILAFIFMSLSYVDILSNYGIAIYPFGYMAVLCFIISLTYSVIKHHTLMVEQQALELEERVKEKTKEITHVLEDLRATQVKLLETGKISTLASLSAGILHQVSQPITAIHGFAKFIKKEMKETEPFYRGIVIIEEQSVYLKQMLEDLMELIRHREIKKENIDINQCLTRSTHLLTDELRIRRVNWDMNLAENLPQVYADAIHLQQVFMNIIVNAVQALGALPKGAERKLKITSQFDKTASKVVILFEDNGPGISEADRKQIFEPFFSTKTKGSGIGLALSKDLIAEHRGEIDIGTSSGPGATFIIRLPAVGLREELKIHQEKEKVTTKNKLNILVVDDQKAIGELFELTLGLSGHRITTVDNAQDALKIIKGKSFDIAFFDVVMPGKDGIELLKEAKHITSKLPIVMMSGYSVEDKKLQAQNLGAVTFLKKPFEIDEVKKIIKESLHKEV